MSKEANTQVYATVRVMIALDVEVSWRDGKSGMMQAAMDASRKAEAAVSAALSEMADITSDGVKMADGTSPKADPRRVSAKLEIM